MKIERVRAFCALFLLAGLLTACGGGGGGGAGDAPSATPLLSGNGADRALAALPNVSPTRAAREDIENGVLLSRISVVLKLDATVADVNAAAQAVGAPATVSGTAATGAAIASGTVTLKCVAGTSGVVTTNTDGSFSIDVSNATLPCVGRVDYKDAGGTARKLHTFIKAPGTANITPLTELLVA